MLRRPLCRTLALSLLACAGAQVTGRTALAHPVTVDGEVGDWFARIGTPAYNLGLVARSSSASGEYIFRDPSSDTNPGLGGTERADLTRVQLTADATNLYVLVRLVNALPTGIKGQLQLAIDLDRVGGSGQSAFLSGTDTGLSSAAAWEYLVRTRFGSSSGPELVRHDAGAVATSALASLSSNGMELSIPWSDLGLSGPPTAPVRFTLATFHASDTDVVIDVAGQPNAVDAVSSYGDPDTVWPRITEEFGPSDTRIDHHFDVYFDPAGEVYAPLLVTRYQPLLPVDSFVELENRTLSPLSLGDYSVGDQQFPDQGEAMFHLPSVTLAPGAKFIVARRATNYETLYGSLPDAEFEPTHDAVVDLLQNEEWMPPNGMYLPLKAGDQLLVIDSRATVVDVVNWGDGLFPLVTPYAPEPVNGQVLARVDGYPDTDNNFADFGGTASTGGTGGGGTGGSATGGTDTGGSATGGSATGGTDTGGSSATGGTDTGGVINTGGGDTGGAASGGASTGGSLNLGGSNLGGAFPGGATGVAGDRNDGETTGGTSSGGSANSGGSVATSGGAGNAAGDTSEDRGGATADDSGCACNVVGAAGSGSSAWLAPLLAFALRRRRSKAR